MAWVEQDRDTALKHKGFVRGYRKAVEDLRAMVEVTEDGEVELLAAMEGNLSQVEAE